MATFSNLSSFVEVPVVDQEGELTGESRTFLNTPLSHFYPEDSFVVIDWRADGQKPDVAAVKSPVTVDGVQYFGGLGWGSMVKKGFTLGVRRDYGLETGMFRHVRDGVRLKRWLLAEGLYGAVVANGLKVKVVEAGTVVNGLPIEDGFGYVSKSAAARLHNGHSKIKANGSRESFQFWSQLPWIKIEDEVIPYLIQDLLEVSDPVNFALNTNSPAMEEKRRWIDLDEDMQLHPYTTNAFGRDAADMYRRAAGTIRTNAHWKVAVPALCKQAALGSESVVYRYPIDDFGAVEVSDADESREAARISQMEVVQFSLSSLEFFASGCLGVVDDDLLDGADIIICADNIKLACDMKQAIAPGMKVLDDVCLIATQWYEAGSALGLNTLWWKKMGGDFDGDLVTHFAVEQPERSFYAVAEAIRDFPASSTLKLKKSRFDISDDRRAEMVVNNINNIVGFASNVRETTFMVAERDELARRLGYPGIVELDAELNFFIKAGTDGFKSFVIYDRRGKAVTMDELEKRLGQLQSNISAVLGTMAPETGWARSDWAFRREVPAVVEQGDEPPADKGRKSLAVFWWMTGAVQEIAKIALPNIEAAIGTPIESRPLTYYRPWAGEVDEDLYKAAHELQLKFNHRVHRVNWNWSEQVEGFKLWWAEEIEKFLAETGWDRMAVAKALWNVAHGTRSSSSGAASIFVGMPDEAKRIIVEKPGRANRKPAGVMMTGLTYNVENPLDKWVGEVEVVHCAVANKGKVIHRAVVCPIGEHPFQFKKKGVDNPWPSDMIGVISAQDDQPEPGFYNAAYRQKTDKSWSLELSA
jgi:hypothetical protein